MLRPLHNVFLSSYSFMRGGVRTNNSGPVKPLTRFFTSFPNLTFTILEQFLPGSDRGEILLRKFHGDQLVLEIERRMPFTPRAFHRLSSNRTYLQLKLRDLISDLMLFSGTAGKPVDLFIGLECVNACFGAMQRIRGRCKKSVYYLFDWAPDRYPNFLLNAFYLWLDRMASYYCDYTWNITYAIGECRMEKLHYSPKRVSPQLYVPYCYDYSPDHIAPDADIDPNLILYSGGLIPENGPHLLIEAFARVAKRFPEARLRIIGGGHDEPELRRRISALGLEDKVEITGYIAEEAEVIRLQKNAALAVAPYPIMKGSRKPYGDVIKIRMYFACGLPVVATPVPPVIREIRDEGLGSVTVDDSPEALADAIGHYLAEPARVFETRRRVAGKAAKSSWHHTYRAALEKMGYTL
jgi:glycosyltransferase involved in cell wall biosynthesis